MIFTAPLFTNGVLPALSVNHLFLVQLTCLIFMESSPLRISVLPLSLSISLKKSNPSPAVECSAPFTMSELNIVLRSLSAGRAPGPDTISADMIKCSPYILKLFLLDHFNHFLSTSTVPDSWALSEVFMLVKKIQQDTRDLTNYRPISLTNTMYKIFASLLQKRLSFRFDLLSLAFEPNAPPTDPYILCVVFSKLMKGNKIRCMSFSSIGQRLSIPSLFRLSSLLFASLVFLRCSSTLSSLFTVLLSSVFATQARPPQSFPKLVVSVKDVLYLLTFLILFFLISSMTSKPPMFLDMVFSPGSSIPLRLYGTLNMLTIPPLCLTLLNKLPDLLQYEAHIRGLTLNFDRCAHLRLHSEERIYFSPSLSSPRECVLALDGVPSEPVPLSDEVKNLGVYLDSFSNTHKAQSCSFKALRRIVRIKSSFYHRVLNPSNEDCSNSYLACLSFDSSRVITPPQIYSQNRLKLLGHVFRHPNSLEFSSTFMPSGQHRYTRGPNRIGRPRLHWAESVMSEASNRITHLTSDHAPLHNDIDNSFFQSPNASHVRLTHVSPSLMWMDNTTLYRRIQPRALDRREWIKVVHKPPKQRRN